MQVTPEAVKSLYMGFQVVFNSFLGGVSEDYSLFTSQTTTENREDFAVWLTSNFRMRQWIGERQTQRFALRHLRYTTQEFEATVALKRQWVEDDRLGLFTPVLQQYAQGLNFWKAEQVWKYVNAGDVVTCWDGQPFFHGSHPVNVDDPTMGTYRNYRTSFPLTEENYDTARTEMRMYKGEDRRTLRIVPNLLVVPPTLERQAQKILKSETIMEVRGLPGGAYAFVPASNNSAGTATLVVVPDMVTEDPASETDWLLVDATKPIKPWGFATRQDVRLTSITDPGAESVFYRGDLIFGADARGGVYPTMPQLMYKGRGAAS